MLDVRNYRDLAKAVIFSQSVLTKRLLGISYVETQPAQLGTFFSVVLEYDRDRGLSYTYRSFEQGTFERQ